ncbi:hypothetical protein Poli38472_011409 [Pythium oligandrum]|uniref:ABC transporter domain-containing protein n=1 Tax=Pythium oligandrum TaxID=41045 RepID=A0A8K1FKT5_PYTOL|nr:hypothetical protein Poli38472_011409 [Pythium oligandrum]|eukprot:TMW64529.1 hypothetical protein Poli38472_011409 [Pythium oligandrum]
MGKTRAETAYVAPCSDSKQQAESAVAPALRRTAEGLGKPPLLCTLSWSDVSYNVSVKKRFGFGRKTKKAILKNVSGRCAPGELTAVMGPSGCGKTTLLDILADRICTGERSGIIESNGVKRQPQAFRSVASYVAQEEALLGCFTVRETLQMAAQLTLPHAKLVKSVLNPLIDHVIQEMGLWSCEKTYVGDVFYKGISGGQKRRLSIAIELLSNPSVLLLDEPTSGLDSAATYKLIQLIGHLCQEGRTVICTIHQPSSLVYNMFTNIMILAKGETVYFGPRRNMIPHFAAQGYECPPYSNPSEYFNGLVNADFEGHGDIPKLVSSYSSSLERQDVLLLIDQDRRQAAERGVKKAPRYLKPSAFQQFIFILLRNLRKNIRNPGIYAVRLAMYIILAAMVGTMFLRTNDRISDQDTVILLFGVHAFFVFNTVAVVPFFIEERAVFLRERGNSSLNVVSYVLANYFAAIPGIFILALFASVIVVYLAGLKAFGYYLLNMFLSMLAAESVMHVLGTMVNDGIIGIALGASLFGMFALVEGFMIPRAAIPTYWRWMHYLALHSYAFKTFLHMEFVDGVDDPTKIPFEVTRLGVEDVNVGENMATLAGYSLILEVVFALILYKVHTGRR